jgi:ketosteroid isomerase-like protein
MSQENVELVRRGFEAFNRGDLDAAVADFSADCEYIPSGAVPDAAPVYRGPEGYKQFGRWLWEEFDDARIEVHELIDAGDQVMVSMTNQGRGRRSGAETSWHVWQVWTVRDGKVARGQGFTRKEEALEAAGLRT